MLDDLDVFEERTMTYGMTRLPHRFVPWALALCCATSTGVAGSFENPPAPPDRPGHQYTNRLVDSADPYLLLHAHNPVDWYPWGPEARE